MPNPSSSPPLPLGSSSSPRNDTYTYDPPSLRGCYYVEPRTPVPHTSGYAIIGLLTAAVLAVIAEYLWIPRKYIFPTGMLSVSQVHLYSLLVRNKQLIFHHAMLGFVPPQTSCAIGVLRVHLRLHLDKQPISIRRVHASDLCRSFGR